MISPFFSSVVLLANKAEKNPSGNSKPRWRRQRGSLWSKKNNVGHHRPLNGLSSSLEKKTSTLREIWSTMTIEVISFHHDHQLEYNFNLLDFSPLYFLFGWFSKFSTSRRRWCDNKKVRVRLSRKIHNVIIPAGGK